MIPPLTLILLLFSTFCLVSGEYFLGVGIADCTGSAAEITFMGYGKATQRGCGIHLRQFSRAFIFDDSKNRVVFVSVDAGMMGHGIHRAVISNLRKLYNDTYTVSNVILSGTHTHSAPGGFLMDFMYDIPSLGFVKETFDALVEGITKSIVKAHQNMVAGKVFVTSGEVHDANINRSPAAYLLNPKEEREKYKYDVDKTLVQLKLVDAKNNTPIGAINWFAVHPTSMNNTNCLITSDNVGYASLLLEQLYNNHAPSAKGNFVSAFASTNLGDVSPNTKGPRCLNTGKECDLDTSTCDHDAKYCVASGPGKDMFESTKIIAEKLFDRAKVLLQSDEGAELKGPIAYVHQYVDMPTQSVEFKSTNGTIEKVHGCLPAMGFSFAAGTTDGMGENGFSQGTTTTDSYWVKLRDLLFKPTQYDIDCHYPKPILINSGRISTPYEWQPRIISTQIVKLGWVYLLAVPGEFTTMSGRRLREAVEEVAKREGEGEAKAIITGLSNVYSSYIATPEEYQMQRYEGASTIYGPHTLTLYLAIYRNLTDSLIKGVKPPPGPTPPNLAPKVVSLAPKVMFDTSGFVRQFGECLLQPQEVVGRGSDVVVKFVSGHPRNDLMHEKTFLVVERKDEGPEGWKVVATDADWETKFIWSRTSTLIGGSEATVEWKIPQHTLPGTYRIRHFGHYKSFFGGINPYSGTCNSFRVT